MGPFTNRKGFMQTTEHTIKFDDRNEKLTFSIDRQDGNLTGTLIIALTNGQTGSTTTIITAESRVQYRLLAEFFGKIADQHKEPNLEQILTMGHPWLSDVAVAITKM